ncbi:SH3 domain-containing kinase-binding protein 1 isoform X2 [Haplochromis burtoni]|uniref:SH3 domain-containing kinase-binding protein 1 isoform X2 n=1 Tax=Haplochromis burtoni TaxID=8153 RepID=UPI001C2D28CE|nr:SH3 domain-containing kinase-binding protein 1 isoform X2 [Haplochromis burtoni]
MGGLCSKLRPDSTTLHRSILCRPLWITMGGVELPQMLLYLSGEAGKTRCRLKGTAGFFCLSLYSSLSRWAAIVQPSFPVTLMMEEERKKTQSEVKNSLPEGTQQTTQNGSIPPALETKTMPTESFSSLLPKAISAVLHPAPPAGINSQPSRNPEGHASPNLEQLQTELRDLKGQFEQMKTQHNKEIKLLMNELDEEKRIRLTLQMEIQRMKKHMSK